MEWSLFIYGFLEGPFYIGVLHFSVASAEVWFLLPLSTLITNTRLECLPGRRPGYR